MKKRIIFILTSLGGALLLFNAFGHLIAQQKISLNNSSLSDEFDNSTSLGDWQEGPSLAYDLLDVNDTVPGFMSIVPRSEVHNGWFGMYTAPYRYKLVSGNFVAETYVIAGNRHAVDPASMPASGEFNSVGFVARDPASDMSGLQNYVMLNIGYQATDLSSEVKTTVNSSSILTLTTTFNSYQGRLLLCRVADTFYSYRWMDNEVGWRQVETAVMPMLPQQLQVGIVANAWDEAPNGSDLFALVDYVRFSQHPPNEEDDCLNLVPIPPELIFETYLPIAIAD
ncbi:MAG: hypothetical protein AAF490_00475 [Chloroflexota bacterium]